MGRGVLIVSLLAAMAGAANAQEGAGSVPAHDRGKAGRQVLPAQPFHVQQWASLSEISQRAPVAPVLNLDAVPMSDIVEEITVYGRRHHHQESEAGARNSELRLGSTVLSGTTAEGRAGFSGMTITAATPVGGVPGLDAVLNLSGGHDQVTETTTTAAAAVTAGFRLKF